MTKIKKKYNCQAATCTEDNRNRQMFHVLKTTETARCFTYWRQQKPPDVARTEHNTNNKMLRELFVCLFDGA